jgi:TolB-like protein/tetratricopeptide (TPR) repeat protein
LPQQLEDSEFQVGDWLVEPRLNRLRKGSDTIALEPKTMAVLVYLVARAGEVVSAEEILTQLWPDTIVNDGSVYWYVARLRKAFGDSPRTQQTIQTLPKKGYRLVAPVKVGLEESIDAELQHIEARLAKLPREYLSQKLGLPEQHHIAVLPFLNLGADDYFCDGLTEELVHVLAHVRGLQVVGRTSTFVFKKRHLDLRVIGKLLNVSHILEGSVRKSGSRVRVTAQLINTRDGLHIWSDVFERKDSDLLQIQQEIALTVAEAMKVTLVSGEERRINARYTKDPAAWEMYLIGRQHWATRSANRLPEAIRWYRKAVEKDPTFALAHAGIAAAQSVYPWYGHLEPRKAAASAKEEAEKALQLAPDLAEAHAAMGAICFEYDFDWSSGEKHLRRSVDLKPSCAEGRHWYGDLLSVLGRHDDALAQAILTLRLEPLSVLYQLRLARILDEAGRHHEATDAFTRALEMDPLQPLAHALSALHFLWVGQIDRAGRRLDTWSSLDDAVPKTLARNIMDAVGDKPSIDGALTDIGKLSNRTGVYPTMSMSLLLMIGETERAADCYLEAASIGHPCTVYGMTMPWSVLLGKHPGVAEFLSQNCLPTTATSAPPEVDVIT